MVAHHHCQDTPPASHNHRYKRILLIALIINLLMFFVEMISGWKVHSTALLADAVDFLGDALNYALSLWALHTLARRSSQIALFKSLFMGSYGLVILLTAIYRSFMNMPPEPLGMGLIGGLALVANTSVAALLFTYRKGDANRRSVWLCTRNDALSNLAVMLAALGVFSSGSAWPDLLVASVMSGLAITSSISIFRQANQELKHPLQ